jgi:hypothetical protein
MPRFLLGWILGLAGAAVGLILCSLIFGDDFDFDGPVGFLWALVIFAILSGLFTWITFRTLMRHAGSIVALTGLISTFVALVVTTWISDSLTITGASTWFWATLIIWLLGMFIWLIPGPWRNFKKDERR